MNHPANFIDLKNKRFARLVVLEKAPASNPKDTSAHWLCLCDCGTKKVIRGHSLRKGMTTSCGCFAREKNTVHGMHETRVYSIWEGIKERCLNQNRKEFKNYGGRGISLCKEWYKFEEFYKDMGDPPKNHIIDRKDNDGDYTKDNCRWVTYEQSNNNTRHNVYLTIGDETKTITQWCRRYGVKPSTAFARIFKGWDKIKAVSHKPNNRSLR